MNHSFQDRVPPIKLAAMVAQYASSSTSYTPWYLDSGATTHIANDHHNLFNRNDYTGFDKVTVSNGDHLPITHTDKFVLSIPNSSFCLNEVLYVPHIACILPSVNQFLKDNSCVLNFTSHAFFINDLILGRMLFQRKPEHGLYAI